jgi:hypothetical protein
MEQELLSRGDVFLLKKGQTVYMKTLGFSDLEVVVGKPSSHQEYQHDEIKVKGRKFHSDQYLATVEHPIPPAGEYRVTRTSYGGGGTGMGPHDVFPDGHRVYAKPVNADEPLISFYQTGCFTAMIENPKIVSRV